MSFLDATRAVREFTGGPALDFKLAMSGTPDPLTLYLRAAAARIGFEAKPAYLPFNTLHQAVFTAPDAAVPEIFLLTPWDLLPELDWRTGVTLIGDASESALIDRAAEFLGRVQARSEQILYVSASCPPLWLDGDRNAAFLGRLCSLVQSVRGVVLPGEMFSLSSYLASGTPINSASLDDVSTRVIAAAHPKVAHSLKVIVTDLDQTLWAGVVGDDGPKGLSYAAQGKGYPHFLYQTLLSRLREAGVLLAAVSKNDPDTALAPLRAGNMVLNEGDFVAVLASWNAKSAQIRLLAEQLNLGLDSFMFVDDNPVELAEVERELPMVARLQFPKSAQELPALFSALVEFFPRSQATAEDQERTQLYRRRLEGMVPSDVSGADLTNYLLGLQMTLVITDRSAGDRARAVQLLNKTNQFNANGRRVTDEEVQAMLNAGGKLYTATLGDRTGSHGEILVALIDLDGVIRSFVMSCRVFQRRVEFAFVAWLAAAGQQLSGIEYCKTERNEPFRLFLLGCLSEVSGEGIVDVTHSKLGTRFTDDLGLFRVTEERG